MADTQNDIKHLKHSVLKIEMANKDFIITWHIRKETYDLLSLYYNKEMADSLQVIQLHAYGHHHTRVVDFFIPQHRSKWIITDALKAEYHSYRVTLNLKLISQRFLPLLTTVIGNADVNESLGSTEEMLDFSPHVCGYSYYEMKQWDEL